MAGKRIVVAEADLQILPLITNDLMLRGYEVHPARNGHQALALVQREHADVAILDVELAGLDGIEVCRRLRANPRTRGIGVIFLTDRDDLDTKVAAFDAGADDYVIKPFSPRELATRLETVLKRAEEPAVLTVKGPGLADTGGGVVSLVGVKGGVGTSVLASNLAVALAAGGSSVALVDLDLEHAVQLTLLDAVPERAGTMAELARAVRPDYITWHAIEPYIVSHPTGVKLLPGPSSPVLAEVVSGSHVKAFLNALANEFKFVVVDLVSSYSEATLDAFEVSNLLLAVVTPDLVAMKGLQTLAEILKQLNIPSVRLRVVVNQIQPDSPLSAADIRRTLGFPVFADIPYGGGDFLKAVNAGAQILTRRPQHPTSLAISRLAEGLGALGR